MTSTTKSIIEQMNERKMQERLAAQQGKKPDAEPEVSSVPVPLAAVPVTRPKRVSETQTLYRSSRPTMNFHLNNGQRVSFIKGYLLTDDEGIKSHIGQNFMNAAIPIVTILEEGPLVAEEKKTGE